MAGELLLSPLVGVLGDLGLLLKVVQLLSEVDSQCRAGQAGPPLLELGPHLIVRAFLLLKNLEHLRNHVEIVLPNGGNSLEHPLHVGMTALLLEVFYLLPEGRRNLSC